MRFSTVVLASASLAAAEVQWFKAPFRIPGGIDLADNPVPMFAPPAAHTDLWHPAHPSVVIDDCDDDSDDWHWAKDTPPKKVTPPKETPGQQWTTSTITLTSTKTVISCAPSVTSCHGGPKTVYTTITIPKTTTICPVPVPTGAPPPPPPKTTSVVTPPKTVVAPPASTPAPAPPKTSAPVTVPATTPATTVGTVTRPSTTATTTRAIITAGAAQNAQRAGGALAAVALAAAALI